ncbi:MAG: hypothetical protein M0Z50_07935 [Planctomycetia bacterium]|nr:hypothetical protein [Planctomycetia bacterium]
MESHFPRCVHCVSPLQMGTGVGTALKSLFCKTVKCPSCGAQVRLSDAQVMAETFAACVTAFRERLNAALDTIPHLTQHEALLAIGANDMSHDSHRLHTRDELCRVAARTLRMALRHEALGHESLITVETLRRGLLPRAVRIHARSDGAESPEILVMIARVGDDDYVTCEPPVQPNVEVPAKIPTVAVIRRDVTDSANNGSHPGVIGV